MHPGINSSTTVEGWNTIVPTDIPSCVDGGGEPVEHVAVDYVCRFIMEQKYEEELDPKMQSSA